MACRIFQYRVSYNQLIQTWLDQTMPKKKKFLIYILLTIKIVEKNYYKKLAQMIVYKIGYVYFKRARFPNS